MSGQMTREALAALEPAIERMYMAERIDREIDDALGLPAGTAYRWRVRNGCPPNGKPGNTVREYIVYDAGTDELLTMGTSGECAKALGLTIGSFYSAVSRTRRGRAHKYVFVTQDGTAGGR